MKVKQIATFSVIALCLIYITGKSLFMYIQKQKDYNRMLINSSALHAQVNYYADALGRETAKVRTMEFTVNELSKVLPEVTQALKELKIKPSRVQSYSQASVEQSKVITQILRDTVLIINNIQAPAKSFTYNDSWYQVTGLIRDNSQTLHITSVDTIIQVVSRGERAKPWLWFFSKRKLIQTIQSRNPSNHVTYSRNIQIKK